MSQCQGIALVAGTAAVVRCGLEPHSADRPHRFVMEWFEEEGQTKRVKVEAQIAIPMPPVVDVTDGADAMLEGVPEKVFVRREDLGADLGTIDRKWTTHSFFCDTYRFQARGYRVDGFCDSPDCSYNANAARAVGRA
jgi:hypothetical protein